MRHRLVIIKKKCQETENNSTQKMILTNPIKERNKYWFTIQEAKEAPTTSSAQQQQNNATTSTETKLQNIEKENVKPSTDKTATEDTSVILEERSAK